MFADPLKLTIGAHRRLEILAAEQSHRTGMPMMRAQWLEWRENEKALSTRDAFLWGEQMLVAPVVEHGATKKELYLPQGLG